MFRRLCLVIGVLGSATAFADAYDFKVYQLGMPEGARGSVAPKVPAANANFRAFARRLAAAMSSVNLMPPETLGHSAFAISAELSVVDLQGATEITQMPTERQMNGALLLPSIHLRKGLPWSFEVGVRAAWFEKSRMGTGTLELKWALNEGFTYLPDIGVRGYVTKILNSRDFDVTTGGFDLGIGKQFAIAGMVTLTPYIGWNLAFVGASTGNVDFNPTRSLRDADQPGAQFDDYYVFESVLAAQNTNNRFYGGLRLIAGYVMIGYEFSYTALGSFNDTTIGTVDLTKQPVLANNFTLGFDF